MTVQGLINIATGLSCYLFDMALTVLFIFIIAAGIRYMFAGGNTEKVAKAKANFRWVLIGGLVIMGVLVIINSVAANVGSSYRLKIICNITK